MADSGRKDFTQKMDEKITPQNDKSLYQKTKESVTDTADKVASNVTPDNQKSFSQTLGDSVQKGHDDAASEGKTWGESAHEYVESGKKAVANAAEYVSGTVTGAKEGAEDFTKKN